jgi:hypothetical protein
MSSPGIGQYRIGIDPIGEATPSFDWLQTIYAQYANSPVLLALIDYISQWIDPARLVDYFFDNLWNVDTAQGWGLDVWGRIVGVNRVVAASPNKWFGFEEAGTLSADPFDQSPYYSGQNNGPQNYTLSDAIFRQLILAKAAANIWDGSIPGLNNILRLMFPGEICYVTDGEDMTMTYRFEFTLTPVQQTLVINSGVLPHPAGVSISYVQG